MIELHMPTFGVFVSEPNQPITGSAFQQTQSTSGSTVFSTSTPFGASSQPAFAAAGAPAFGATSTAAFGATSTPAVGSSSKSTFGSTGTDFGVSSAPAFKSEGAFGAPTTPAFGASNTFVFGLGSSSAPVVEAPRMASVGKSSSSSFGASSTPGFSFASNPTFSQSTSAFGSNSLFGTSPSPFGAQTSPFGSSISKQMPTFGVFVSYPNQPITGNVFQPTQPTSGNTVFGTSTPFGASSQPAFTAAGTLAFDATSTTAVGSSSTSTFGSTGTAFGVPNAPAFKSGGAFGAPTTPAFGASNTFVFGLGSSSAPVVEAPRMASVGTSSSSAFGASSTPGFSLASIPTFSQSNSAFGGNSSFGTSPSPFGTQTSPFGVQITPQTSGSTGIGQSAFAGRCGGSRIATYTATVEDGWSSIPSPGELQSISAMPLYKDKSHEELRWEDYQFQNKGRYSPAFGTPSTSAFSASSTAGFSFPSVPKESLFGTTPSPFGTQASPFGVHTTSQTFGSTGIGQSYFGGRCGGSRIATYIATVEDGWSSIPSPGELQSISAMPLYEDKSHEELRWEDYQFENKGRYSPAFGTPSTSAFGASSTAGFSFPSIPTFSQSTSVACSNSLPGTIPSTSMTRSSPSGVHSTAVQSAGGMDFNASTTQSNLVTPSTTLFQPFVNPFFSSTTCNPSPSTTFSFPGSGVSSTPVFNLSCFIAPSSGNPFGTISPFISTSIIVSPPAFATFSFPYLFGTSSSPAFASSPSIFSSTCGFSSAPSSINTQSYPAFQAAPCGQSSSSFGLGTAPSSSQSVGLSTGSGLGCSFLSTTPSLLSTSNPTGFVQTTPSFSTPQPVQTTQTAGVFPSVTLGQSSAGFSGCEGFTGVLGQITFVQPYSLSRKQDFIQRRQASKPKRGNKKLA